MTNDSTTPDGPVKSARRQWDWYPTPPDVTAVCREYLAERVFLNRWCDPAAGDGALIAAMKARPETGGPWHAIEIDPSREDSLRSVASTVEIADALTAEWPPTNIVMNPPFSNLDDFWRKMAMHRDKYKVWCAAFTPVAWWQAQRRAAYVRPDTIIALGWRPVFHPEKTGPGHKGSQDFVWAILEPRAAAETRWRLRPRLPEGCRATH